MLLLMAAVFFFAKNISETLSECQKALNPDQDCFSIGPDLGPNCLQSYQ